MPVAQSAVIAITMDLSALPTSSSFLTGVESNQIDNTGLNYIDALLYIKGITGHATTAPAIGQSINVYVWGSDVSLAVTPIDVLDGVASAETLSHEQVLKALRLAGAAAATSTVAALVYRIEPVSIAALFGGVMPKFWGCYGAQSQAGALGAANNNLLSYVGYTLT